MCAGELNPCEDNGANLEIKKTGAHVCEDAEQACRSATFVASNSDVCLYVGVAGQHVAVGAALGRPLWLTGGQHVGGGGRLLRR